MKRPYRSCSWLLPLVLLAACEKKTEAPRESVAAPSAAPTPTPTPAPAPSASEAAVPRTAPPEEPAPDRTPPKEAVKSKSGLAMLVLTPGTGTKHPKATDVVLAKFTGWGEHGPPFKAPPSLLTLSEQPPGWSEALTQMVPGEKARLWMTGPLAYGNMPGAPNESLVLDLELISIPEAPKAPPDVKQAPKDATKLESGLAYKILKKGTGSEHPTASSRVTMHYTGWTRAGKMFDSSTMRGEPLSIGLNQVIPGWTQSVPFMVAGDKMRVWIPAALAYGETPARPGAPAGDLVFDMELLSFK